ncbi:MAG TPA: RluA family pseudouridine synthase [Thermoanaerobaculia bacterium]|nr:RluA family pseudouridine synthase [Thermoanaerobaculia bacterium]
MNAPIRLQVDDEAEGLRLDQALNVLVSDLSRSRLARLISEGRVTLDGAPVIKSSTHVALGQWIELDLPEASATRVLAQDLPLEIVFQDSDIVVINKPAGLVVHPSAGHAEGTLVNALLHHVRDLSGIGGEIRPGIVHRLDKDTSGLMVIAKNDRAHQGLTSVWNSDAVRKEYLAIVYGTPKQPAGVIEAPIGRDPHDRQRMAIVTNGRKAVTHYVVVEELRHSSLLRCRLETGRTHQIRVHLKLLGHPIVGDPVYSGPQWKGVPHRPSQKAFAAFARQALHAVKLTFPHPGYGEVMIFDAEMPGDMQELLGVIREG